MTHYDTFNLYSCKDVSGLCEAFIRKIYCFKGAVNLSDADYSADELRYVRVAVVSFIPRCFGGGSYYIKTLLLKIMGISPIKLFLIFRNTFHKIKKPSHRQHK